MADRLFSTKDVCTAYPWMSPQILHHRIARGFLPIQRRSRTRGQSSLFSEEELVHAGVIDIQAHTGMLNDPNNIEVGVEDLRHYERTGPVSWRMNPSAPLHFFPIWLSNPFDLQDVLPFYRKYQYECIICTTTSYEHRPPARRYRVIFCPATWIDPKDGSQKDAVQEKTREWKESREKQTYGEQLSISFLSVKSVYEAADYALNLRQP